VAAVGREDIGEGRKIPALVRIGTTLAAHTGGRKPMKMEKRTGEFGGVFSLADSSQHAYLCNARMRGGISETTRRTKICGGNNGG